MTFFQRVEQLVARSIDTSVYIHIECFQVYAGLFALLQS
jgi:hypothetical protein